MSHPKDVPDIQMPEDPAAKAALRELQELLGTETPEEAVRLALEMARRSIEQSKVKLPN